MNFETHYIIKPEKGVVVCIIYDCCCNAMALVNKHTGLFEGKPCLCNENKYCLGEYRGVAKCSPEDDFNIETGKSLAAARCNAKVAVKRVKNAQKKWNEAVQAYLKAEKHMRKMAQYYEDAVDRQKIAEAQLEYLVNTIKEG